LFVLQFKVQCIIRKGLLIGRGKNSILCEGNPHKTGGASGKVVDTTFFGEWWECKERRWLKANSGRGRTYSCSAWASSVWGREAALQTGQLELLENEGYTVYNLYEQTLGDEESEAS
jgi:hypothetical protein